MRTTVWIFAILAAWSVPSIALAQQVSPTFSDKSLSEAMNHYRRGEFPEASKGLARYIEQRLSSTVWKNAPVENSWIEALRAYAECCLQLEDYRDAIVTYDQLERLDASNATIASSRGFCYEQLDQWLPAIDNYRLAHVREPDVLSHRLILAKALVTVPHADLRDGKEASKLLEDAQRLPINPAVLEVQSAVAAETGDFDRAIELQNQILSVTNEADVKKLALRMRDLYQKRIRYPFTTQASEPLSELERTQPINQGTVFVRVRGRAMYEIDGRSGCVPWVIDRQHSALVLNHRGEFLITGTSLSIPYSFDPTWNSLDDAQWLEGPFIEVYASTTGPESVISLGRAEVKAHDLVTGLVLIGLIEHPSLDVQRKLVPLRLEPVSESPNQEHTQELTTIHLDVWSPRQQDKHFQKLTEDMPFGEVRFRPVLHKVEILGDEMLTTCNRWNEPKSRRLASWTTVNGSPLTIGSPIMNAAGECVAMVDEVMTDTGLVKVGIPSEVVSRVAASLLSFGTVERASVPVKVKPVERVPFSGPRGMEIYEIPGFPDKEREPQGLIITHVNGVATPHNMAWEAALERASRLRLRSLICTIFDPDENRTKLIEVPIVGHN